jgi:putative SOS response-associated peptidase YedK
MVPGSRLNRDVNKTIPLILQRQQQQLEEIKMRRGSIPPIVNQAGQALYSPRVESSIMQAFQFKESRPIDLHKARALKEEGLENAKR